MISNRKHWTLPNIRICLFYKEKQKDAFRTILLARIIIYAYIQKLTSLFDHITSLIGPVDLSRLNNSISAGVLIKFVTDSIDTTLCSANIPKVDTASFIMRCCPWYRDYGLFATGGMSHRSLHNNIIVLGRTPGL